ncbi:metallophosphoesterase family protein [Arthrobacter sp. MDT2-16]
MSEFTGTRPIAVAGDWHGHLGFAQAVVKSAAREGVKTLIQVGDFGLDWPGAMRGRFEQRLNRLLVDLEMELLVSAGNHDNMSVISALPVTDEGLIRWRSNISVLPKGGRTVIEGLRIGGLGGALSVDGRFRIPGKDWWPEEEEPTRDQAEALVAGGSVDVLIAHDAPMGTPVRSSLELSAELVEQANQTRTLLREVVDRLAPAHVFCGHWHQRVIHELNHPDGRMTRVDVLNMENSREGNCVLVWPGRTPLRVVPLLVRGK